MGCAAAQIFDLRPPFFLLETFEAGCFGWSGRSAWGRSFIPERELLQETLERQAAVAQLTAMLRHRDHDPRRDMSQPNGGFYLVAVLAARPSRTERLKCCFPFELRSVGDRAHATSLRRGRLS